jgi:hypothetical protein
MPKEDDSLRQELWSHTNKKLGYDSDICPTLAGFSAVTADIRTPIYDSTHRFNILVLEELICWYISCSKAVMNFGVSRSDHMRAIISPLLALSNLLIYFYTLVQSGLGFSMRVLARSIGEHNDVLRLLLLHPELASEFITEDKKQSNSFWHKYLARDKERKKIL